MTKRRTWTMPKATLMVWVTNHINGVGDGPFVMVTGLCGESAQQIRETLHAVLPVHDEHGRRRIPREEISGLFKRLYARVANDPRFHTTLVASGVCHGTQELTVTAL